MNNTKGIPMGRKKHVEHADFYNDFIQLCRQQMKHKRYNQSQLAEVLGISRQMMSQALGRKNTNGRTVHMGYGTMAKLAEILEIRIKSEIIR